jgi:hypothetical protein
LFKNKINISVNQSMKKLSVLQFIIPFIIFIVQSCVYHSLPEPENCDQHPVVLELVSSADTECAAQTGSLEVVASGGTGIYRYKLDEGTLQSGSLFANLAAGTYTVTASDDRDCSAALEVTIRNQNGVNMGITTLNAGCQTSNGSITVIPADGIGPYSFKINESEFQQDSTFNNLSAGTYSVVVKDATGCESAQSVQIKSGVSFSASISSIIESKCAISGCHNGAQFPDLRTFQSIHANAAQIRNLTGNRSMPETGSLTQAQIDAIACWVNDGADNN